MTNREKIEFLLKEDGIRDKIFLQSLLHNDFRLEWDSSTGNSVLVMSSMQIMKFLILKFPI
jgi:hypothetical protein